MAETTGFKRVEIGDATLYHGNCLDILPSLEAASHVIKDPPYEDHMHNTKKGARGIRKDGGKELQGLDFASINDIRDDIAKLCVSLCDGWLIAFATPEGVAPWRDALEAAGARYKRACVWVKPDAAPQFNGQGPAMGAEMIVTAWCGSGVSRWNGGGKRGVWECNTRGSWRNSDHPTEKPLPLMCQLIGDFTNRGDTILDPFMGSGTTGAAALLHGRKFIGIEQDEAYFNYAVHRLEQIVEGDLLVRAEGGLQASIFDEVAA